MYTYDNNNGIAPYSAERSWGCEPIKNTVFKPEILAPASYNSYKSAIYNGADAIYFGYKELNARASGENFSDLKQIVDFCHIYNVKAYLAINIELKNSELELAKSIVIEAEEAKIDAFIISDLSLITIIKKYSKAQIHASTQMGIHNYLGAHYLEKLGFDRVVLSREVSLNDIKDIKKYSNLEIEVFVHGALCVGFSGACLMSSMLNCNSGNRGRCNQLCRQYYSCEINNKFVMEGYLLSAKDVNLIENLDVLEKYGIDSYKIEGRLRRQEYVGGVTKIYQHYNTNKDIVTNKDLLILKKLFNRGNFTTLYMDNKNKIYPYVQSNIGTPYGKVIKVKSDNEALVQMDYPVEKNDGFKVLRNDLEVSGGVVTDSIVNTDKYYLHTNNRVEIGDIACITTDNNLNNAINNETKKVQIEIGIRLVANEKPHIIASANRSIIEIYGDNIIAEAKTNPLTIDEVKKQFSKTLDTYFEFAFINVVCKNAFINKAGLNELRRQTIEKITSAIIEEYERKNTNNNNTFAPNITEKIEGDFAEFSEYGVISSYVSDNINNIVYNPNILEYNDCLNFYEKVKKNNNLIFIKPPIFVNCKNINDLTKICSIFDGIIANNLGLIELADKLSKKVVASYNLNITNSKNPLIKVCNQYIISTELNKKEIASFKGGLIYTYGRLPLMYLTHCPRLLAGQKCNQCGGDMVYKDQKGEYPIISQKFNGSCVHTLKNGIITNIGNLYNYNKYFDFTNMKTSDIEDVICQYYIVKEFSVENYNHLHLSRGVY
jgi:putative protease